MKHKIIDALRASQRVRQIETYDDQSEADRSTRSSNGRPYASDATAMGRSGGDAGAKDFSDAGNLSGKLPPDARIFMYDENGWSWKSMKFVRSCVFPRLNAWVILYRARIRCGECLDLNWSATRLTIVKVYQMMP